MRDAQTWAEVIANIDHYRALGQQSVYINSLDGVDWTKCVDVSHGGLSRHGVDVSISLRFVVEDDDSPFEIMTLVDAELPSANGKPHLEIETPMLAAILGKLPPLPAGRMRAWFRVMADNVRKDADSSMAAVMPLYGQAAVLERLSQQDWKPEEPA